MLPFAGGYAGMIYLYHGTDVEIDTPIPGKGRKGTDFGQGFYLTPHLESAVNMAHRVARRKNSSGSVVMCYSLDENQLVSPVVRREAAKGNPDAAKRRLEVLTDIPDAELTVEAGRLAEKLVDAGAVPAKFKEDALHIAIAAVACMDYLVSWNFRHITNAQMIPKIKKVCADNGYVCAEICTPQMLSEGGAQ